MSLAYRKARVMAGVKRVGKTGYNKHHGYPFATDGDVSDCVRALLAEHGIGFSIDLEEIVSWEQHGKQNRMVIRWTMRFENADNPSEVSEHQWFSESLDSQDKGIAKAATAAVKYFLLKTFLVSTGEEVNDTDSQAGDDGRAPARGSASKPPPKTSKEQLSKMRELVTEAGGTWDQFVEWVGKSTGGPGPDELPADAAGMWIARLQQRADQVKAQEDGEEEAPPAESEEGARPHDPPKKAADKAKRTDTQRARDAIKK